MKLPKDVSRLLDKIYDEDITTVKRGKRLLLGNLYLFGYDAKYKTTLPYWDALPLTILLGFKPPHMVGINIHYLFPWTQRIKLVGEIMKQLKSGKKLKYKDINRAWKKAKLPNALLRYAYRKYLISHIRTNIKQFDWEDWRPAVVNILPKFQKEKDKMIAADILRRFKEDKAKGKIG